MSPLNGRVVFLFASALLASIASQWVLAGALHISEIGTPVSVGTAGVANVVTI